MAFYNTFCDVTHAYQQFTFMIIYAGFFFFFVGIICYRDHCPVDLLLAYTLYFVTNKT
jgi:hypothetical protein